MTLSLGRTLCSQRLRSPNTKPKFFSPKKERKCRKRRLGMSLMMMPITNKWIWLTKHSCRRTTVTKVVRMETTKLQMSLKYLIRAATLTNHTKTTKLSKKLIRWWGKKLRSKNRIQNKRKLISRNTNLWLKFLKTQGRKQKLIWTNRD